MPTTTKTQIVCFLQSRDKSCVGRFGLINPKSSPCAFFLTISISGDCSFYVPKLIVAKHLLENY